MNCEEPGEAERKGAVKKEKNSRGVLGVSSPSLIRVVKTVTEITVLCFFVASI